ncbi:MAG: RNB domain-containing ribonuclease, partial [Cyclobacteriaceae bacterium]|nr:RNB domain-containing ribonuclease [Cyclobacteriaceae bacterium]
MTKKKKKKKGEAPKNYTNKLKPKVLSLLDNKPSRAYSTKQIIKRLGFKNKTINREIPVVLAMLERDKKIERLANGSFKSVRKSEIITGIVDHVSSRFAYIIPDNGEEDIYVRDRDLKFAMDRDTVRVQVFDGKKGSKREGEVIEVVSRARSEIVGRVEITPRFAFVIADNKKIHQDIFIKIENLNKAGHNDKVIVHLTAWPSHDHSPEGKVVRVLGKAGENNAEIHSIMAEYGLPFEFPTQIEAEAEAIPDKITKKEIEKRRDMRSISTFTIDPEDAKDFDDALSFQILENGRYEIGVHIADVTHYV